MAVSTLVRTVANELVEQVAIGGMHFDSIESGFQRTSCSVLVVFQYAGNLIGFQCTRHGWLGLRMRLQENEFARLEQRKAGLLAGQDVSGCRNV